MKQSLFFSKIVFFSYTGDPTSFKSRSQSCYLLLFSEGSKSMRIFCFSSFLASILYVLFTFFWHTFGQLFVYTTFLAEYIGFEFDIYKFLVYIFCCCCCCKFNFFSNFFSREKYKSTSSISSCIGSTIFVNKFNMCKRKMTNFSS